MFKEKSTHHVVSDPPGYHVNRRTAHVLLDLNVLYLHLLLLNKSIEGHDYVHIQLKA
jgi:hypothetical protein